MLLSVYLRNGLLIVLSSGLPLPIRSLTPSCDAIKKTVWLQTSPSPTQHRAWTTGRRLLSMSTTKSSVLPMILLFLPSVVTRMSSATRWRTRLLFHATVLHPLCSLRAPLQRVFVISTTSLLMIKTLFKGHTFRFSGRNSELGSLQMTLVKSKVVVTCQTATRACSTPRILLTVQALVPSAFQVNTVMS